jgi:glyceraldehyde 3-phosphate dehydrogenase
MTTVHAYTSSQQLVDGPSKDFRRGRAGAVNPLPASTGAALATTKALPELAGRFDGVALRVPIAVGSIADITLVTTRPTSITEVNDVVREEASTARYRRVLGVAEDPIVTTDIIRRPARLGGGHGDDPRRRRLPSLVKIMSWYDNEWSHAATQVTIRPEPGRNNAHDGRGRAGRSVLRRRATCSSKRPGECRFRCARIA